MFLYPILVVYCDKFYVFYENPSTGGHFETLFSKFFERISLIVCVPNFIVSFTHLRYTLLKILL